MARYLVVAHRTAKSPELAELRSQDPVDKGPEGARLARESRFVLLAPAVPPAGWVYEEGEIQRRAKEEAEAAKAALEAQGIAIEEAKPGDVSPILALEEELMAHPGEYQAIVLATLPPGLSRWLRLDVHSQAERFGLPVIHVIAH